MFSLPTVLIKGAGDLASGIAHRLHRSGFFVIMTELRQPLVVRRTVSFASAVWSKAFELEGVNALCEESLSCLAEHRNNKTIPIFVDPEEKIKKNIQPDVYIDAAMAKKNNGTSLYDASIVIGIGPGFKAGQDVHAVVETKRGHYLGKVILNGGAAPNTGVPGELGGYGLERLLKAPGGGLFKPVKEIGDPVEAGQTVAMVDQLPVKAKISGVLRGLLHQGVNVKEGLKVGDVDPRGNREHCFSISDKARAVAGGSLEAIMYFLHGEGRR